MTRHQVKEAIKNATDALREYKRGQVSAKKGSSSILKLAAILEEINPNDEIDESVRELVKEAYEVGQAGKPCPNCGGSGRV